MMLIASARATGIMEIFTETVSRNPPQKSPTAIINHQRRIGEKAKVSRNVLINANFNWFMEKSSLLSRSLSYSSDDVESFSFVYFN